MKIRRLLALALLTTTALWAGEPIDAPHEQAISQILAGIRLSPTAAVSFNAASSNTGSHKDNPTLVDDEWRLIFSFLPLEDQKELRSINQSAHRVFQDRVNTGDVKIKFHILQPLPEQLLEQYSCLQSYSRLNLWLQDLAAPQILSLNTALQRHTSLHDLQLLSHIYPRDAAASRATVTLAVALSSKLSSLNLSANDIGPEGAASLACALPSNSSLRELHLSCNYIGFKGVESLTKALESNLTLTLLNLDANQIGDEGVESITTLLKKNTTLRELVLRRNNISTDNVLTLVSALTSNTSLTKLDLSYNFIGERGARILARLLATNSALTSLDLYSNRINGLAASTLARLLATNSTLTSLNLKDNPIDDEGKTALDAAMARNPKLTIDY